MQRSIRHETIGGIGTVVLEVRDGPISSIAHLAPQYGGNLCRWTLDGHSVIDFEPAVLRARGYTGTPVLYPTPSLVSGGELHAGKRIFRHNTASRRPYEHGLVHDLPWQAGEPAYTPEGLSLMMWIDFKKAAPQFHAFPFPHTLRLTWTVGIDFVRADWRVENMGAEEIPFGFGLHPYFQRLCGERGTRIRLPARYCMEASFDLLPTGRLVDVAGQPYDVREFRAVGELNLDHVYTGLITGAAPSVEYADLALAVELIPGPAHTHLVCYAPPGEPFVCIENYTCSTDAHNMYARGFVGESGLKFAPSGGIFTDYIVFRAVRG